MENYSKAFAEVFERAKIILGERTTISEQSFESMGNLIAKAWITRQYFSMGKNSVVFPAWIAEQLIPKGNAQKGFGGTPLISNDDTRNFFALASPFSTHEVLVDHRGGIIPKKNTYTLLFGTMIDGKAKYSSEIGDVSIELNEDGYPILIVKWEVDNDVMVFECMVDDDGEGNEALGINVIRGFANHPLFVTITPFDQDGITEIKKITFNNKENVVEVEGKPSINLFSSPVECVLLPISEGHAGRRIGRAKQSQNSVDCEANAASWAASFPVRAMVQMNISLEGNLDEEIDADDVEEKWEEEMEEIPEINTGHDDIDKMFRNSAIVLRMLTDLREKIVTIGAGGQHFVWPQALFGQIKAMNRLGFTFAPQLLDKSIELLKGENYFENLKHFDGIGSVLFAIVEQHNFNSDTNWLGEKLSILKKITETVSKARLMAQKQGNEIPIGETPFVQEWFRQEGTFFFQLFWIYGITKITSKIWGILGRKGEEEKLRKDYEKLYMTMTDELAKNYEKYGIITAGPGFPENSLIILNLQSIFPLKIFNKDFKPIMDTVTHIWKNYVNDGGLMIFQPWNSYGTYHAITLAQVSRLFGENDKVNNIIQFLVKNRVNDQGWAEAISPRLTGGSVGDSPNAYVAAEFINLISDLFATKEENTIRLLEGMPKEWMENGTSIKNLRMDINSSISLDAKIKNGKLTLNVKYNGNADIVVVLPTPAKMTPKGFEQIGHQEYKTSSKSFKAIFMIE